MDILIPVGGVQNNDYRELRYSLRSIEKHMLDIGRVFIAGDVPSWLVGVEELRVDDIEGDAVGSVQKKLEAFCKVEDATEDFLFTHDDILAVKDFSGADLPFYASQDGVGSLANPLYFQVHTPVRYNRKMYAELFANPDNNKVASPRALYCNFYKAPATKINEVVLRVGPGMKQFSEQIGDEAFFSLNDRAAGKNEFLALMADLYPTPSRWELPENYDENSNN